MSDVGCSLLGAGAWGWPREILWGGRWEGGSCLGTHVRIKDFKIKKITDSISLLMFDLFKLSISFWFNFVGLYVSRSLSIASGLSISAIFVVTSPFSLLILFEFSLFYTWSAWPEVYQFSLFFQRTSSWFYWFFFPPLKKSLFPLWSLLFLPSADFSFFLLSISFK